MSERHFVTPGFDPTTVTPSTLASEMFSPNLPVGETLTAFIYDQHFGHGITRELLVGQEGVKKQVEQFIDNARPGDIELVVGPFGTGKTSVVNRAVGEAAELGVIDKEKITTTFANQDFPELDPNTQLLRVEEFGRISDEEHARLFAQGLRAHREAGTLPPTIITGDATLDDERFLSALSCAPEEVNRVEMEPYTTEMVPEALRRQLKQLHVHQAMASIEGHAQKPFSLEDATAQAEAIFSEEAIKSLFDKEFLQHLTESTDPSSVSMRDVMIILQGMLRIGAERQSAEHPFRFNGEWYKEYRRHELGEQPLEQLRNRSRRVVRWLQGTIQESQKEGRPFRAISMPEMLESVADDKLRPTRVKAIASELEGRYIKLAVSSDFYTDEEKLYGTRFVPTPKLFLDTHYAVY